EGAVYPLQGRPEFVRFISTMDTTDFEMSPYAGELSKSAHIPNSGQPARATPEAKASSWHAIEAASPAPTHVNSGAGIQITPTPNCSVTSSNQSGGVTACGVGAVNQP